MWGFTLRKKKRVSPLHRELSNLKTVIAKTERLLDEMSDEFWRDGGVCCPSCGCEGYRGLLWKQERRAKRVEYLERKLN